MRDPAASVAQAEHGQHAEYAVKTPEDLDRYRLIIDATEPVAIIETGTFNGRSALWFARQIDGPVATIDIDGDDRVPEPVRAACAALHVDFIRSNSTDPELIAALTDQLVPLPALRAFLGDRAMAPPVLVSLDSDHSAEHVYAELCAYSTLVQPGDYIVAEDTIVRYLTGRKHDAYVGSPLDAVERFLAEHDEFENDLALEDLHDTTQHPGGWLRRIR